MKTPALAKKYSVVAVPPAHDAGPAGDEGADQQADEEEERRRGRSLARRIRRLAGLGLGFLLLGLDLVEGLVHLLLGFLLRDPGALRDQLRGIAGVLLGQLVRANGVDEDAADLGDRKSTRLNSSHLVISYADFRLTKTTLEVGSIRVPRAGRL